VVGAGVKTRDLGGSATTTEFADEVIQRLKASTVASR
jgi:isocitrate/isopropylmalate dehydrogenase